MIPLRLRIAGFLSYREPVEIDFTGFDLACISGNNGAGKSSLLDAITWALFGQARRRDEALINLQSKAAEVTLVFEYEDSIYRIQRALPRGKTGILEFQVMESDAQLVAEGARNGAPHRLPAHPVWRPLTERTLLETQACIEETLRLDYDTFVNASFFLQGKADQFTQQTASKRKEVLGSILGLEVWEQYKVRTGERRKRFEDDLLVADHRIAEIDVELAEAAPRKKRLNELEAQLLQLSLARQTQAGALDTIRRTVATLEEQRKVVAILGDSLERARAQYNVLCGQLEERDAARSVDADLMARAASIQAAYETWRQTVANFQSWDQAASAFREVDQQRAPLLQKIGSEKARLEEEQRSLLVQAGAIQGQAETMAKLEAEIQASRAALAQAEARVAQRLALEEQRTTSRYTQATLVAENDRLKAEMKDLRERIDALASASGVSCPLCGQELSVEHRASTLQQLEADGKERARLFRLNKDKIDESQAQQKELDGSLAALASADADRIARSSLLAQLTERLQNMHAAVKDWESKGSKRLKEVTKALDGEKYALEHRKELARLDKHLATLGYDAAAHDATRAIELEQRAADDEYRKLEAARAALAPLESEIARLKSDIASRKSEIARQEAEYQVARSSLDASEGQAPDLRQAENAYLALCEQENVLNQDVGAARQKVAVLDELRIRRASLADDREALAMQISRHKALERAFSKDGVPALLIEQALPEIESKANELLERLSDGRMSVRFLTQAGYKDKKREDLRETLEIQISDGAGLRDYEMYSGGEAFRVDFAIRLALSEVLAQRKGARLQTLVIDEGFGSQDVQGRQRLIEAINIVKDQFAKILVITHLDELKDAFPTRIEVEKTAEGSVARVI
ncbi:MAG: AAA family ATPase [Anaerolineae bacterium]